MHPYRKLASVLVAMAIPMGAVVSLTSPAWAKTHHSTKASGTVSCTGTTATLTFKPPLTPTGTSQEKAKLSNVAVTGCTGSSGAVTAKVKAIIKGTSTNSCANFATGTASDSVQFNFKWSGGLAPTTVKFGPGTIGVNNSNNGFTGSGGVATGSFATTSATFTANIGSGLSQLTACIGGSGTVSSIQISSGSGTF